MELGVRQFTYGDSKNIPPAGVAAPVDFLAGLRLDDFEKKKKNASAAEGVGAAGAAAATTSTICPFTGKECKSADEYMMHTATSPHVALYMRSNVGCYLKARWEEGAKRGWDTDEWGPQRLSTDGHLPEAKFQELLLNTQKWNEISGRTADGLLVHRVDMDDTLAGIAIKYGTTTAAIKVCNKLGFGGNLHALQSVIIPQDAEVKTQLLNTRSDPNPPQIAAMARAQLLKQLRTSAPWLTEDEAVVTLSIAGFDLKAAVDEAVAINAFDGKDGPGKLKPEVAVL